MRAAEEAQESIHKRKGRMDELSSVLTRTHIGLSQLEHRLSSAPRLVLRGNLRVPSGGGQAAQALKEHVAEASGSLCS